MLPFLYFTNAISITLFRNRHKRKHRNITNFAARWERCQLGHKDGHQGFHPCESRFLYFLVWRRPETGDRFEKEERQRIFPVVRTDHLWGPSFSFTYSQFGYPTATHIGYSAQAICVAVRCLRTANISRKTRCGNPTAVPIFEAVAGLWSAPD